MRPNIEYTDMSKQIKKLIKSFANTCKKNNFIDHLK